MTQDRPFKNTGEENLATSAIPSRDVQEDHEPMPSGAPRHDDPLGRAHVPSSDEPGHLPGSGS